MCIKGGLSPPTFRLGGAQDPLPPLFLSHCTVIMKSLLCYNFFSSQFLLSNRQPVRPDPLRCQVLGLSDFLASSLGLTIILATLGLTQGRLEAIWACIFSFVPIFSWSRRQNYKFLMRNNASTISTKKPPMMFLQLDSAVYTARLSMAMLLLYSRLFSRHVYFTNNSCSRKLISRMVREG